jgi:hypothetical protein
VCEEIDLIFPINVTKASSAGSGGGKNGAHPLCQWSEIPGHPGRKPFVRRKSRSAPRARSPTWWPSGTKDRIQDPNLHMRCDRYMYGGLTELQDHNLEQATNGNTNIISTE